MTIESVVHSVEPNADDRQRHTRRPTYVIEESPQHARQFVTFMWIVACIAIALSAIELIWGLAARDPQLYVLPALTFGLSLLAFVAGLLARAGHPRLGLVAWVGGASTALLILTLIASNLLFMVMIATLINLMLSVIFFTPRLKWPVIAGVTLFMAAAAALELGLPYRRYDVAGNLPWLALLLYPMSIAVIARLLNLFGAGLQTATDAAQANMLELEQRRAELLQQTAELRATTGELVTRTGELEKANLEMQNVTQQAQRRAELLQTSSLVTHTVNQLRNLDELLPRVTLLIGQAFGYYHVGIFIVDELGRAAVLRSANSPGGQRMLARGYKVSLAASEADHPIASVIKTGQPLTAHYAADRQVISPWDQADLPDTRTEIVLPLSGGVGSEIKIFGALDAHSAQAADITEEDLSILGALADQIAIAIENAQLFARTQAALQEAQEAQARFLRHEWEQLLPTLRSLSHEYRISGVPSVGDAPLPEILQAIQAGSPVTVDSVTASDALLPTYHLPLATSYKGALAVPIKLRDQVIGVIDLHETDHPRQWTDDDVALVSEVADQAAQALENVRLFEQTQRQAQREQLVATIATRLRAASDVEGVLRAAVHEIRRALGASHGVVRLKMEDK